MVIKHCNAAWPQGYKTFCILNTAVGILTFISMINTTSESLKARKVSIFQHFSFCELLKFHTQLNMKKFYSLRPDLYCTSNTKHYIARTAVRLYTSFLWDIGKQCRPRSDAAECGL